MALTGALNVSPSLPPYRQLSPPGKSSSMGQYSVESKARGGAPGNTCHSAAPCSILSLPGGAGRPIPTDRVTVAAKANPPAAGPHLAGGRPPRCQPAPQTSETTFGSPTASGPLLRLTASWNGALPPPLWMALRAAHSPAGRCSLPRYAWVSSGISGGSHSRFPLCPTDRISNAALSPPLRHAIHQPRGSTGPGSREPLLETTGPPVAPLLLGSGCVARCQDLCRISAGLLHGRGQCTGNHVLATLLPGHTPIAILYFTKKNTYIDDKTFQSKISVFKNKEDTRIETQNIAYCLTI
ncbi:hypothetical protein NDU88_003276 [Pleurodeles waltl]|uniref:Uncharacterized protein n=1 Tax=Pleurodeles waltl TaxID=8319 RepID=A0AAV7UZJ0_PLEWA|nr:hypothetical protein NDU88_003276 [Pleurodeles waltl]